MSWNDAQVWEQKWWGDCCNSLFEEMKQITYVVKMGLKFFHDGKTPYNIDMQGKSVLDVGGGPVSLLLKCCNVKGTIIDPCNYPLWVMQRYILAGINFINTKAEEFETGVFDLGLCYNVLQHVENPELIIKNMKKICKEIRIFEWIENGVSPGHPHNLTELELNRWLGGKGKVEFLSEPALKGKCYSGIFKGDNYNA